MTDPQQATTVKINNFETTRKYSWPPLPPHQFTVTSVTSAIKHGLPKPYLVGWSAKATAEAAIKDHDVIDLMLKKGDKKGALQHIKGARYRNMNEKADRGNIVHSAIDAYLSGTPWTTKQIEERMEEVDIPHYMRESTRGMINGVMGFLFDSEPEIYFNEATLYSRQHGYAGTADIGGKLFVGKTRNNAIIDVKTSPRIYDEVALQLVAYARADFVGHNDGTEGELIPGGGDIQYGIVIRPKADGTYERADFTLSDELFNMFLHLLGTADAVEANTLEKSRRPTVQ